MNQPIESSIDVRLACLTVLGDDRGFWKPLRVADLAAGQGLGPVRDVAALAQPAWSDVHDIDADLRALRTGA